MRYISKHLILAMAIPTFSTIFPAAVRADEACKFNENRSGICGDYDSEISPAEAFLNTVVKRGKWSKPSERPVIIDVRSTPEYRAGHPEHAYNVPSPYIYQYCDSQGRQPDGACIKGLGGENDKILQTEEDFVSYVESIVPDKKTPIYTLCRTGVRSVGAAEFLTKAGYTNVRNIWEGFVGVNLKAPFQDVNHTDDTPQPVDLNHDGALTDEDKNGWRYHQGLPYETRLLPKLIYQPRAETYDWD